MVLRQIEWNRRESETTFWIKNGKQILNKSVDQNYRKTSRLGEEENPRSSCCMWAGRSDFLDFLVLFHQVENPDLSGEKVRKDQQLR